MRTFVFSATIAAANAYLESLADCQSFASQFSNTCGGTAVGNAWQDYTSFGNWGVGTDVTCDIRSDAPSDQPDETLCPGGNSNSQCTVNRKVCVTCRLDNSQVYIRMQSNGLPNHCYGTAGNATDYPDPTAIDFEVKWNRWVVNDVNYIESATDEQTEVENLLCNYNRLNSSLMMSQSGYTRVSTASEQEQVAGYALTNVAIWSAVTSSTSKTDGLYSQIANVDKCGTQVMLHDATSSTKSGQLFYRGLSICMKPSAWTSTTLMPTMCGNDDDNDQCIDYPIDWALNSWTTKTSYGGDVGLARDGHVIKGPYNGDGELWGCDDHDICNGAFLADGSYAYVTTTTFPYVVGCWGPASVQNIRLSATCTHQTCGARDGLTLLAGALALFIASNTF